MRQQLSDTDAKHYRFSRTEADLLLDELIAKYPLTGDLLGCYRIPGDSAFSDIARHIECQVFDEFFGNAPEIMAQQYGCYEHTSEFLVAVDISIPRAVGALRFIHHSDAGFKTLNDITQPPLCLTTEAVKIGCGIDDWSRCWDIATVAVIAEQRGQMMGQWVSTALYAHLYARALERNIEHFIAILDRHAYSQLTRTFAIPFSPILDSPPFDYLGSVQSYVTHVQLSAIRPHMESFLKTADASTRAKLQPYFNRLLNGTGLPRLIDIEDTYSRDA